MTRGRRGVSPPGSIGHLRARRGARPFRALDEAGARFVVVGGLAVVLHGYARLTADVDLVVDLAPGQAAKTIAALERIGMVPRAPVPARDFADPERRREWVEEKGMRVLSMHDPRRPLVEVDLFVVPPVAFDELFDRVARGDARDRARERRAPEAQGRVGPAAPVTSP